jgi:hypothetical protein
MLEDSLDDVLAAAVPFPRDLSYLKCLLSPLVVIAVTCAFFGGKNLVLFGHGIISLFAQCVPNAINEWSKNYFPSGNGVGT